MPKAEPVTKYYLIAKQVGEVAPGTPRWERYATANTYDDGEFCSLDIPVGVHGPLRKALDPIKKAIEHIDNEPGCVGVQLEVKGQAWRVDLIR